MSMIKEFKEFAMRGSVVDLAVGIVIGGAFGKIVSSFVNDILMPPLGVLIGGVDFSELSIKIKDAVMTDGVETAAAVSINYGSFIQTLVDFIIIAFAIFLVVKAMNSMKKKNTEVAPAPAPPAPTNEEKLLAEIRDLLKK
jgi:large conductance mechanosensitive channel